jgi:hypothetical protein
LSLEKSKCNKTEKAEDIQKNKENKYLYYQQLKEDEKKYKIKDIMKMASPSAISIKSKKCGSPGRVYSPRPKLQEYMQSLTNQSVCNITGRTDGITREVISSISPNNRQFSQNNNQTLCN